MQIGIDKVEGSKRVGWDGRYVQIPSVARAKALFEGVKAGDQAAFESALLIYRFAPTACTDEERKALAYICPAVTMAGEERLQTYDPEAPEEEPAQTLEEILAPEQKKLAEQYRAQLAGKADLSPEEQQTVEEMVKAIKEYHTKKEGATDEQSASHATEGGSAGGSIEQSGDPAPEAGSDQLQDGAAAGDPVLPQG